MFQLVFLLFLTGLFCGYDNKVLNIEKNGIILQALKNDRASYETNFLFPEPFENQLKTVRFIRQHVHQGHVSRGYWKNGHYCHDNEWHRNVGRDDVHNHADCNDSNNESPEMQVPLTRGVVIPKTQEIVERLGD